MELKLDCRKILNEAMENVELEIGMTLKEAVNRQIAEKPICKATEKNKDNKRLEKEFYLCPCCKSVLYVQHDKKYFDSNGKVVVQQRYPAGSRDKYCRHCGKRLKWEGD